MLFQTLLALALTAGSFTSRPSSAALAHSFDRINDERHTAFGVAIAPVPERVRRLPYLMEGEGVVLTEVRPGGAAEAADLKAGDIILAIDGKRVDESTIFSALREAPRNQSFRVEFLRGGKWKAASVMIDG